MGEYLMIAILTGVVIYLSLAKGIPYLLKRIFPGICGIENSLKGVSDCFFTSGVPGNTDPVEPKDTPYVWKGKPSFSIAINQEDLICCHYFHICFGDIIRDQMHHYWQYHTRHHTVAKSNPPDITVHVIFNKDKTGWINETIFEIWWAQIPKVGNLVISKGRFGCMYNLDIEDHQIALARILASEVLGSLPVKKAEYYNHLPTPL